MPSPATAVTAGLATVCLVLAIVGLALPWSAITASKELDVGVTLKEGEGLLFPLLKECYFAEVFEDTEDDDFPVCGNKKTCYSSHDPSKDRKPVIECDGTEAEEEVEGCETEESDENPAPFAYQCKSGKSFYQTEQATLAFGIMATVFFGLVAILTAVDYAVGFPVLSTVAAVLSVVGFIFAIIAWAIYIPAANKQADIYCQQYLEDAEYNDDGSPKEGCADIPEEVKDNGYLKPQLATGLILFAVSSGLALITAAVALYAVLSAPADTASSATKTKGSKKSSKKEEKEDEDEEEEEEEEEESSEESS